MLNYAIQDRNSDMVLDNKPRSILLAPHIHDKKILVYHRPSQPNPNQEYLDYILLYDVEVEQNWYVATWRKGVTIPDDNCTVCNMTLRTWPDWWFMANTVQQIPLLPTEWMVYHE